jgi:transcriptional regulator NrdR family protein
MNCIRCKKKSSVLDSRIDKESGGTRRKRKCDSCGHIFRTLESAIREGATLPKKKPVAPKKQPTRRQKKIKMNKRLQKFRREEVAHRIDNMTDDELEEAIFSGEDLRELGLD